MCLEPCETDKNVLKFTKNFVLKFHYVLLGALILSLFSPACCQICSTVVPGVSVVQEGVSIMTGLTYNGKDENGNALWDSCANIRVRNYEKAATCHDLIRAFNINTNRWMAK